MKYAILFREPSDVMAHRTDPARAEGYWAGWMSYVAAINASGMVTGGAGLDLPATATFVRVRDGERQIQEGPFGETHDELGGFFLVEADDLDAVLEWAARSPAAAVGSVEVRPVLPPPPSAAE